MASREELEQRAKIAAKVCRVIYGETEPHRRARIRYAGILLELARHRPLTVQELEQCGLDHPEAVRVANATRERVSQCRI